MKPTISPCPKFERQWARQRGRRGKVTFGLERKNPSTVSEGANSVFVGVTCPRVIVNSKTGKTAGESGE
jgi:hypothetical protein